MGISPAMYEGNVMICFAMVCHMIMMCGESLDGYLFEVSCCPAWRNMWRWCLNICWMPTNGLKVGPISWTSARTGLRGPHGLRQAGARWPCSEGIPSYISQDVPLQLGRVEADSLVENETANEKATGKDLNVELVWTVMCSDEILFRSWSAVEK